MSKFITSLIIILQVVCSVFPKELPDYIEVCKRDQATINSCVRKSIERLRPKLAEGMPEFEVPPIDPFYIPELIVDSGNLIQFHAVGKDVQVSGAGNFSIKNVEQGRANMSPGKFAKPAGIGLDGRAAAGIS